MLVLISFTWLFVLFELVRVIVGLPLLVWFVDLRVCWFGFDFGCFVVFVV